MSLSLRTRTRSSARNRRGGTIVLLALLMAVIVGMVAFTVEIGRIHLLRSQIKKAVDSGTLAATLKLVEDETATDEAAAAARQFVQLNRVGFGVTVPDDAITIDIGQWDSDTKVFTVTNDDPDAVRVVGQQSNEPFFFARIFGQTSFAASATSIAAGSGGPLDIMMVLDLSGSMGSNGRIEALQSAAPIFVETIEEYGSEDTVGVMGFGVDPDNFDPAQHGTGTPYTLAPQSLYPSGYDYVAVLEADLTDGFSGLVSSALDSSGLVASKYYGGTPTGAGIRDATHYLTNSSTAREDVRKAIVLMSDGNANKPGGNYPLEMADYAASLNVKVYTISLGSGANVSLMEEIAERTGATHFDATGSESDEDLTDLLISAFQRAAAALRRPQLVQ